MGVTKVERGTIETTLAFANLPRIESPSQVQAVFGGLPFTWAKHWNWVQDVPASAFRKDQRRVRRWLAGIAQRDLRALQRVIADVNKVLARTTHPVLRINPKTLRGAVEYRSGGGVEELCAVAVWDLFDSLLLRRVRRCPLRGCGRFRVTYEGRVWNYCSIEHQREGERLKAIERVKRWRALGPKRKQTQRG
jgi:hypothetical protein